MKRGMTLGASALVVAMAITACSGGSGTPSPTDGQASGEIQDGGILRIGMIGDPGSLDPTFSGQAASFSIFFAMCEALYRLSEDDKIEAVLADGMPEMNDDFTTARVKLREGVLFQDGTPFDAESVAYTLNRHVTAPGTLQESWVSSTVSSWDVIDEHTIDLHLASPMAADLVAEWAMGKIAFPISPTAAEEAGFDGFAENPVCVGPFEYESYIPQTSVKLVKAENYYDADQVHLDGVEFAIIPDNNVRVTNLRSGDLDVIENVAPADVGTVEGDGFNLRATPGIGFYYIGFNSARDPKTPIGQDPRIRQAFEMSIDREAINNAVFSGQFEVACGFMAPSHPLASENTTYCTPYDPEGAKALLEDVGVATPISFDLVLSQQPEFRRMAEVIQSMTAETGFDVRLDIQDGVAVSAAVDSGDFDAVLRSWAAPALDSTITRFAHSARAASMTGFADPRVDELLLSARAGESVEQRIADYDELDAIMREDASMLYVIRPKFLVGQRADVADLVLLPSGWVLPTHAGFVSE